MELAAVWRSEPQHRDIVRLAMAAVGRGGSSDLGQRIRDDILVVQSANNAKGGMMEQWHQKLHNNTSPDDVVICEALLAYINAKLDIGAYWSTLEAAGVTRERLASYDRSITHEPEFSSDQCEGLHRDLTAYLSTLRAVHSGDDLGSAAERVLGFEKTSRKGKQLSCEPLPGVASDALRETMGRLTQPPATAHGADDQMKALESQLEDVLTVRRMLASSWEAAPEDRLQDVLFLDLALEGTARRAIEGALPVLRAAAADSDTSGGKDSSDGDNGGEDRLAALLRMSAMCLESAILSNGTRIEEQLCLSGLQRTTQPGCLGGWLAVAAALERTARALGDAAVATTAQLQPSAEALGRALAVEFQNRYYFCEEVVRGGPAAPLAQLLAVLQPAVAAAAGLPPWAIVAPGPDNKTVTGRLVVSTTVEGKGFKEPTVLLVEKVGGDEDVPPGVVAILSGGTVDVLSHAAVRARNLGVMLAVCRDPDLLHEARRHADAVVCVSAAEGGKGISMEVAPDKASSASGEEESGKQPPKLMQLEVHDWCGKWAIPSSEFDSGVVGAKSLNLQRLQGKLPQWIGLPQSVAVPFGAFEAALEQASSDGISSALSLDGEGPPSQQELSTAREAAQTLGTPEGFMDSVQSIASQQGLPSLDADKAWAAIKAVWASKWNERAFSALTTAGATPGQLQMAVLLQAVIPSEYAWVAHTRHPVTGDTSEVFVEVVRGLGETLVGNYPGAALAAVVDKKALSEKTTTGDSAPDLPGSCAEAVRVVRYPSKSEALMVNAAATDDIIFRSDSNGEDLEGYAGAGLFDSVTARTVKTVPLDPNVDRLTIDASFQRETLFRIAAAAAAIERLDGVAQDVEGCLTADGRLWVVQSRPQV